ncbi:MAG: alpha/beta hydrolase [Pseudomonadota bacterium]
MSINDHLIKTGADGRLDGTSTAQIDKLIRRLSKEQRVVIHLHGGLVSTNNGIASAAELEPEYEAAGAYPVYFIYRTGLLEIVRNNLGEIAREKIFQRLLVKIIKFVMGKLTDFGGRSTSAALALPTEREVRIELQKCRQNIEPFVAVAPAPAAATTGRGGAAAVRGLTATEKEQFLDDLSTDPDLQTELQEIINGAGDVVGEHSRMAARAGGSAASRATMMSEHVVHELVGDGSAKDARGVYSSAKFFAHAMKVLGRVISRFRSGRDHGVYATVVEELARELYLDNVGRLVWNTMKKETAQTFESGSAGDVRGGRYFVDALSQMVAASENPPEITVVAHSLGSVFACNLMADIRKAQKDAQHPWPKDYLVENLIFLAPAVEHSVFAKTIGRDSAAFRHFRMFSLNDTLESGYWEVPVVYPRSLLYLVSGAFEETDKGDGAFDRPLVGMQRYHTRATVYRMADVKKVRNHLNVRGLARAVWSETPANARAGQRSDAIEHATFNDVKFPPGEKKRRATVDSLRHIIRNGMN